MTAKDAFGDRVGHPATDLGELGVVLADDDEDRHRELAEPRPQRCLGAGAGETQARREAGRGVREAGLDVGVRAVEAGEQRLRQPAIDEGGDSDALDLVGQLVVGGAARRAFPLVLDPWCRPDQHQPIDELRRCEGEVQAQAPAHRVADVRGAPALRGEHRRAGGEVGANVAAVAVARGVECHDVDVGAEARRQSRNRRPPAARRLREAVDEDDSVSVHTRHRRRSRRRGTRCRRRVVARAPLGAPWRRTGGAPGRTPPDPGRPGSPTGDR